MSLILGYVNTHVEHDDTAGSPGALPGQNLPARYLYADFWILSAVTADLRTYIGINGGRMWAAGIHPADYPVLLAANRDTWGWSWSGDDVVYPSSAVRLDYRHIEVGSDRSFEWNLPDVDEENLPEGTDVDDAIMESHGMHYIGQLDELGYNPEQDNDAFIYVSGTGDYAVTDPIYPEPARVYLPHLRQQFLNWRPLAALYGETWYSCNHEEHASKIRRAGSFEELINSRDESNQHAWYLSDGSWEVLEKVGIE